MVLGVITIANAGLRAQSCWFGTISRQLEQPASRSVSIIAPSGELCHIITEIAYNNMKDVYNRVGRLSAV